MRLGLGSQSGNSDLATASYRGVGGDVTDDFDKVDLQDYDPPGEPISLSTGGHTEDQFSGIGGQFGY
jgi:hypothetical protein